MDEWERGVSGICYGLYDPVGPFTVISFGSNDEQYPGFSFANNENMAQDSQILEKKMILERKIDGVPVRKLFVSNIDKHARNCHVYNIFKEFGEIVNIQIRKQHVSERYRDTTYGFVTFKSTEAAARALSCTQPLVMNNRVLTCNPADSWHQPIVNPDGTVEFGASFLYDKNNKNKETEKDEKDSNDVLDEDDIAGAVGGLLVSTVSSQEAESCPISRLNDDCLWHIFSKLPIDEQIIVGKVCRRWHSVVLSMCRKIECLNFKEHFSNKPIQMDMLQSLLEYIGPNLKVLNCDVGDGYMYIDKSFVSIVARYCRNLEVLDITNVNIASRSFQFLAKQCTKLRSVSFTSCIQLTDIELMNLFGNHNIKLESITLKKASELRGKCFTSLKPSVKYLSIDMCNNIKPELLMLGLQKVNNSLVDLKLKNCMAKWGYSFERIAEILPNLNKLTVTDIYPLGAGGSSTLMPLGLLTELEYLDLSNNFLLCDVSLTHLVNSCKKLKTLILVGQQNHDNGITRTGIIELSKLENLEELNISCQEGVDDDGFKLLTLKISQKNRIKKFVCFNCINLGDKGVSCILSSCPELELLDLSECSLITNETIDKALAVVKKRDNNVVLTLMLYGTNVSLKDESSYQHPLLKLDFSDTTSMRHINLFNQFILECGEGHSFHGRLDCQCCIALGDDDMSHSADDIEDLFFDIDDLDFDSDEDVDYDSDFFGEAQNFS